MRVAITDASFKHSLALATYLKRFDSTLALSGIHPKPLRLPSLYKRHYHTLINGNLEDIVAKHDFDLVIPVGNQSVETLSKIRYPYAVLPSPWALDIALSKAKTLHFAKNLDVPVPQTFSLGDAYSIPYPLVVKGSQEAGKNLVSYVFSPDELNNAFETIQKDPSQKGALPMIQEYVKGTGLGFFAYYQQGELKRFYMHRRLREYPVKGGSATAAETYFHKGAFLEGKKLLDKLQWNGPCMVEFKYDLETGVFKLLEINPKFWGSLELGLKAGLNFGEYLIASLKKENLTPCLFPNYPPIKFYWPFDGDIRGILEQKKILSLLDYCKGNYSTNRKTLGFRLSVLRFVNQMRRTLL